MKSGGAVFAIGLWDAVKLKTAEEESVSHKPQK